MFCYALLVLAVTWFGNYMSEGQLRPKLAFYRSVLVSVEDSARSREALLNACNSNAFDAKANALKKIGVLIELPSGTRARLEKSGLYGVSGPALVLEGRLKGHSVWVCSENFGFNHSWW